MNQYGVKQYWDNRYLQDNEAFDWYQRYPNLKHLLLPILQRAVSPKILVIGCGNSRLSEDIYTEGFKNIMNIDYSEICVKQMNDRYGDFPEMKFICMDCRDIVFESGIFDLVIDKGTLDSILCSEGASDNAHKTLKEICRVLKPGGTYFCVSYGVPEYRLHYLSWTEYGWTIVTEKVKKPLFENMSVEPERNAAGREEGTTQEKNLTYHYVYLCKKNESN